jgi:SAM-dependent methyltransferase
MSLFVALRKLLAEPRLEHVDINSDQLLDIHRQILMEKPMMRNVFREFYNMCISKDNRCFTAEGSRVELGAGVSFFKELHPEIVSTDIKSSPWLDRILDAQEMDLPDDSVRAFYAINCFHHLPDADRFFQEMLRTLRPGGGCVLIEPYHGPVASRFYERIFDSETFDKSQADWKYEVRGVMDGANQALSYIVFKRDLNIFIDKYPQFEVVEQRVIPNYLRYLLSGGLNFRQLMPSFLEPVIRLFEFVLTPLHPVLGLHHCIIIRKRLNHQ